MSHPRILLAAPLVMPLLLLAACGTQQPAAEPPTPQPSEPPSQARGQNEPLPDWAASTAEQTAGRFVIIAASPDVRLDATPEDAWARAAATWGTPELHQEVTEQKPLQPSAWWADTMVPSDGWVKVTVSNIESGEQPQAVGASPEEAGQVEVIVTREFIRNGQTEPQAGTKTWTVQLTDDGGAVETFNPPSD